MSRLRCHGLILTTCVDAVFLPVFGWPVSNVDNVYGCRRSFIGGVAGATPLHIGRSSRVLGYYSLCLALGVATAFFHRFLSRATLWFFALQVGGQHVCMILRLVDVGEVSWSSGYRVMLFRAVVCALVCVCDAVLAVQPAFRFVCFDVVCIRVWSQFLALSLVHRDLRMALHGV